MPDLDCEAFLQIRQDHGDRYPGPRRRLDGLSIGEEADLQRTVIQLNPRCFFSFLPLDQGNIRSRQPGFLRGACPQGALFQSTGGFLHGPGRWQLSAPQPGISRIRHEQLRSLRNACLRRESHSNLNRSVFCLKGNCCGQFSFSFSCGVFTLCFSFGFLLSLGFCPGFSFCLDFTFSFCLGFDFCLNCGLSFSFFLRFCISIFRRSILPFFSFCLDRCLCFSFFLRFGYVVFRGSVLPFFGLLFSGLHLFGFQFRVFRILCFGFRSAVFGVNVLRKLTCQLLFIAFFRVGMAAHPVFRGAFKYRDLHLAADGHSLLIETGVAVAVGAGRLVADQPPFFPVAIVAVDMDGPFLLPAGQFQLGGVAGVRMVMSFLFLLSAGQLPNGFKAALGMLVAVLFFLSADQVMVARIALFAVPVFLVFLKAAGQLRPVLPAFLRVVMSRILLQPAGPDDGLGITAVGMMMAFFFRFFAGQYPLFGIATACMRVAGILVLADQDPVCFVTGVGVFMRFLFFQAAGEVPLRVPAEFVMGMIVLILHIAADNPSLAVSAFLRMLMDFERGFVVGSRFLFPAGQVFFIAAFAVQVLLTAAGILLRSRGQLRRNVGEEQSKHSHERKSPAPWIKPVNQSPSQR